MESIASTEVEPGLEQLLCVTQRVFEARVLHVHQRGVLGNAHDVELRLRDKGESALGAAQDGVQIEAAVAVPDVSEVIAGEAAIELGKALFNQRCVLIEDGIHHSMHFAHAVVALLDAVQLRIS